jgi:ATP-dependent DNA ligase
MADAQREDHAKQEQSRRNNDRTRSEGVDREAEFRQLLRKLPLLDRKRRLEKLIKKSQCREILYAHHIVGNGVGLFEEICARDLEGIIAKRKRGVYREDGNDWLKIKNLNDSRAEGRHEVLLHKRK